jgi:MFS family permease
MEKTTTFKIYPQVLIALAANGGAFIFGILLGWSAPTAPQIIEQDENSFWITGNQFSWVVAMMSLGAAFSCVFSGIIRSKIGTRLTILSFGVPIVIGWILITLSVNPAMVKT